jgi:hypothetical protein
MRKRRASESRPHPRQDFRGGGHLNHDVQAPLPSVGPRGGRRSTPGTPVLVVWFMSELEAAEEAADAAASEARREIRKKRKAEFDTGVEDRMGKLKEKLHVS